MIKDFKIKVGDKEVIIRYVNMDIDSFLSYVNGYGQTIDDETIADIRNGKGTYAVFEVNGIITIYTDFIDTPYCYFTRAAITAALFTTTKYGLESQDIIDLASDLIGLGTVALYDYDYITETATRKALTNWEITDKGIEPISCSIFLN